MLNGKNERLEIKKQVFPPFRYFDFRINCFPNSTLKNLKLLPGNKFIFKKGGGVENKHPCYIFNQKDHMIAYLFSKCMSRDEQCRAAGISNKLFYLKKNLSNLTSRDCILLLCSMLE